ncbi:MAG: aldo/keto reductase [Candidatus Izemoplasmatales bacterium]|jgi:diketogulonate reductase-like aldo/keto reductase
MKAIEDVFVLHNGVNLPKIGLGTWQSKPGDETYEAVRLALKHGYRHIDTAMAYNNEKSVGKAVKASGVPREEIFVTTKLPAEIKTYDGALEAFDKSLSELEMDYVDLYLIHAPWPWNDRATDHSEGNKAAFLAMEKIYNEGKAKAIGVSNFKPKDIAYLMQHCSIVPHVNQIAYFIGLDQSETISFCRENSIVVEAYSPLGIGYLLSNETIREMALKYKVSPAQICIRWCLQKETAPLPKTVHEHRLLENMDVDFEIDRNDMEILDSVKGDPRRWK